MNYCYTMEYDENGNVLKEVCTDEYGNEEVTYCVKEDTNDNNFEFSDVVKGLASEFKLQLTLNKTLYEDGIISKELYERIENLILERVKPFEKYIDEV